MIYFQIGLELNNGILILPSYVFKRINKERN